MKFFAVLAAFLLHSPAVDAFPTLATLKSSQVTQNATLCYPWPLRELKKAAPFHPKYPYLGAKGSEVAGSGKGDVLVPAKGDIAHEFHPPAPGAYRGPCSGLNVAANHGFLSCDGVSSFDELVEMQQNLWNFGFDTSVCLAALAIALDGYMERGMLSIGADASCTGQVDGAGLNLHDTFEVDTSYARNDYYMSPIGDNWSLNATLWADFVKLGQELQNTSKPVFNIELISAYKSIRSDDSKLNNPKFHRGPGSLLLYGAAGAVNDVFGGSGLPTYDKVRVIHGVEGDGEGGYIATPNERLPPNFYSRKAPWTLSVVAQTIWDLYMPHQKELGHNDGSGNWIPDEYQFPKNGTAAELLCFLHDGLTNRGRGPSSLPYAKLKYITERFNPHFVAAGCRVLEVE